MSNSSEKPVKAEQQSDDNFKPIKKEGDDETSSASGHRARNNANQANVDLGFVPVKELDCDFAKVRAGRLFTPGANSKKFKLTVMNGIAAKGTPKCKSR